jgi:diacylglycerol kinase (ATP)
MQVFDLGDKDKFDGPEPVLESFCNAFPKLRVLVCGGDGTVSWITSAIEKVNPERRPPLAILPLGTGNDLARFHGWGGGYNNEPLIPLLEQVTDAFVSMLDRWELEILPYNARSRSQPSKKNSTKEVKKVEGVRKIFTNYWSIGADAQAALQVHNVRLVCEHGLSCCALVIAERE